jgi:D-xylonolactonase
LPAARTSELRRFDDIIRCNADRKALAHVSVFHCRMERATRMSVETQTMKQPGKPVVIADYACHVGENPLWHAAERRLYWTDILSPRLFAYDPVTKQTIEHPQPRPVGGFTVQADGALLLFRDRGNVAIWRNGKELATIIESIPGEEEQRFNDVIADPEGRVFAGTLTLSSEWADVERRTGRMYRIERDGSYSMLFDGIGISNGMGFSPDLRTLYFADTLDCAIWQFDYDRATGRIDGRRPVVQTDPAQGRPDGLTVDSDGNLWVAMVMAGFLDCYAPDGKRIIRIELPTSFTTSVAFGGDDYSQAFITSGKGNDRKGFGPLAGATFAVQTQARGRPEFVSRVEPRK